MKRFKVFGYSVHQSLVVLPLAMLSCAIWFDVIFLATAQPLWARLAFGMITGGLITGLVASPFGWLDWTTIKTGTPVRRIGLLHGMGNSAVLVLFALSWYQRRNHIADPNYLALTYSFAGAALTVVTSWLGAQMAERLGWDSEMQDSNTLSTKLLAETIFVGGGLRLADHFPGTDEDEMPPASPLNKRPSGPNRHAGVAA